MIKAKDIHVFQKDSRYVVFHPESFSLFYVTDDIGAILKSYEMDSKHITSKLEMDLNNILDCLSEKIGCNSTEAIKWANSEPIALNLLVSQDCNLKCGYCYADHGTYGSEKKLMKYDTAKKCIDKLLSKDSDNFIVFFGGEPLLNFSLIKKIDSYLSKKKLNAKYTAITNGTIMSDEIKNFINKKFFNLNISLDGPKYINDGQRFGLTESVYDCIIETIEKLHPRSYPILIKSIATKKSVNKLTEIVEHISSLNIDSLAIESVNDVPPESDFFISEEDHAIYITELINILTRNIKKLADGDKVAFKTHIYNIVMQIITRTRKINMCSAGREFITITAEGDVYPCHMFIGLNEFHMGNVHNDDFPGEKFNRLREMFYKANVYNSPECNTCWARFLCGGECHWHSYRSYGDLSRPREQRCFEMKSIIEALLPEIAEIFQDNIKTKNLLNSLKLNKRNKALHEAICKE